MKLINKLSLSAIVLISALFTTAHASIQEPCKLGQTCSLPRGEGSMIYYNITQKDGVSYSCSIKSSGSVLEVYVTPGKEFNFSPATWHQWQPYASDKASVTQNFTGQFLSAGEGQFKITNKNVHWIRDMDGPCKNPWDKSPALAITCNAVK